MFSAVFFNDTEKACFRFGFIESVFKRKSVRGCEAGCSEEEGPKKGCVMGSRTQGVQEILEKYI